VTSRDAEADAAAKAVTRWLCDREMPPVVMRYGAAVARACVRMNRCRDSQLEMLTDGELMTTSEVIEVHDLITSAAREKLRRYIDQWWETLVQEQHPLSPAAAVVAAGADTTESAAMHCRAAQEIAYESVASATAEIIYCGRYCCGVGRGPSRRRRRGPLDRRVRHRRCHVALGHDRTRRKWLRPRTEVDRGQVGQSSGPCRAAGHGKGQLGPASGGAC
jgi:hypothetical protein